MTVMMRASLRTQILLLIAGTVACLTIILLGALTLLTRLETERTVQRDVQATRGVLTQLIRERGAALTDKCLLLARQPRLLYLRDANAATIADSLGEWLPQMHADAAALTDQDGRLMGATDLRERAGSDRHQEPGVARALDGQSWSGIVAQNGRLQLGVCVPVVDGASHVVLMTFTAYSAIDSELASELQRSLGSDLAFVYQGRIVGASLTLPTNLSLPHTADASALVTVRGHRYFSVYAPLPAQLLQPDVGFVTLRDYDAALRPYQRFQRLLLLALATAGALALGVGALMARGLTRPLDGVVQAAAALSRGEWPQRFDVRRRDEIGLLQTVFNDMTDSLRTGQERLLALIDADPLTELDNHRRFQERLAHESRRCALSGEALSLLLFDLDHFQEYNRRHGHTAGDQALRRVADALRAHLPDMAILARYGGKTFVALLPQQNLDGAEACAERVRTGLKAQEQAGEEAGAALTLSVGCAELGPNSGQGEGLALAAELAVSRAKQLGRDRVCRFDSVPGADQDADPHQLHRVLKDGSLATIQALAAAVDAKDSYTQGHSRRVAEYATELARAMGATEAEQDLIYTTGTLHDVGKIGVPDAILKKPGRLDDDERLTMETHPVLGEVIVRKAPQLAASLPGVRHHHERWDGKGYPDGLAGTDIPRMARFLAVADTYDAMTSDRPYRKGMPHETALNEIARGAGTQFDPDMAPAFVQLMRQKHIQTDLRAHMQPASMDKAA